MIMIMTIIIIITWLWDQVRMIRKNGWLIELEMNVIKKSMVNENAKRMTKTVSMTIMMIKVGYRKRTSEFRKCFAE